MDRSTLKSAKNLGRAAYLGDIADVAASLKASPLLLTLVDDFGRTPLHWAVAGGQTATVKYLLGRWDADSMLVVQDFAGNTPLHCFCGPPAILHLLHSGGACEPPTRSRNKLGQTAIEAIAAANGMSTQEAQAAASMCLSRPDAGLLSFMRRSCRRIPPAKNQPRFWGMSLTTVDVLYGVGPLAVPMTLMVMPPSWAFLPFVALLMLLVILGFILGFSALVREATQGLFTEPRMALIVLLTLGTMLALQNGICFAAEMRINPRFASVLMLLQCITVAAYYSVVTNDPGFVRGAAEADHERYWHALEEPVSGGAPKALQLTQSGGSPQQQVDKAHGDGLEAGALMEQRASAHLRLAFCTRSELEQIPRARFSPYSQGMVRVMDHDCKYLGVCIGAGNHRAFIALLLGAFASILLGIICAVRTPLGLSAYHESPRTRLYTFGVVLGIILLVPVGSLLLQQQRMIRSNVTVVEELRWMRNHPDTDPPRRGSPMWQFYAPHDTGSALRNIAAFAQGKRHIDISSRGT